MSTSPELAVLIGVLQRTSSPKQRLAMLLRAWRQVRRLSAEERSRLALHLGVEGASELLEELAERHDALPTEELLPLLEELKDIEPGRFRVLLRRLRDPRQRAELLDRGLDVARERLLAELATGGEDAAALVESPPKAPPKEPGIGAATVARPPATPAPAPQPASPETPPASADRPPPSRREKPSLPPPPRLRPVPREKPSRVVAPRSRTPPTRRVSARPPADRPVESRAGSASKLAEELRSTASLVARFRLLRLAVDRLDTDSVTAVREILEAFPAGWARRRALQALFRAGVPESREAALALVRELERPTERRWCLHTLAETRGLADDELEGRSGPLFSGSA
jgi:hypothetical protein